MELDDRGGNYRLAPFQTSGKETEDLYRIVGSAQVREKARRRGTFETSLEWRVDNYKATACRLFDKEDCGKGEVPGRKFNRRCYRMGGCIFKRDSKDPEWHRKTTTPTRDWRVLKKKQERRSRNA